MSVKKTIWTVLSVVGLLLCCLSLMLIPGRHSSPSHSRVKAIVDALDKGCQTYRMEYGVYPPGRPDFDSRALYQYLGSPLVVKKGDGPGIQRPPIINFPADWLRGSSGSVSVVDSWDRPIRYRNPGIFNKKGIDIWSAGRNGKDEPENPESDDVNNWVKEY